MPEGTGSRGGIVLGWLIKLSVLGALIGIVGFDGISIVVTEFTTRQSAAQAADAGLSAWRATGNVESSYSAALRQAREADPDAVIRSQDFTVTASGGVDLVLRRRAHTFVLARLPRVRDWALVTVSAQADPSS